MPFDPISFLNLRLRNRLWVAPMTTYSSHDDGSVSDAEIAYLARRAAAGYGAIVTAACYVQKSGHAFPGQWSCSGDGDLPSLRAAALAIQSGGAAAILQIHHGGRQSPSRLCGRPISASAIPAERPNAETPNAMTESEIQETVTAFGEATRRAVEAGFDGVEIHGANTYLLQQFVSPHSNRRDDAWGEDRLKFPLAVVDSCIRSAPEGFAIGYRLSPEESETPGIRFPDTLRLVDALSTRNLSYLHVSLRDYRAPSIVADFEEPVLARLARYLRGRLPLVAAGCIWTRADAEEAISMGADAVAVGRAALVDPEWPRSIAESGQPATRLFRRANAATRLTLPKGLIDRIVGAPGWLEMEPE